MANKPLIQRLARTFSVVFALAALGYLVVDAQQRAMPPADRGATPPEPSATPAVVTDAQLSESLDGAELELEGFDFHVFEFEATDTPGFLYSSKVAPVQLERLGITLQPPVEPPEDGAEPVFLGSSKSMRVRVELPRVDASKGAVYWDGRAVDPLPPIPFKLGDDDTTRPDSVD